jgi:bifunctional non-homologous end joining protein LigD
VVLDKDGKADFQALLGAMGPHSARLRFCAFDLLELDGVDLRRLPLGERKARLARLQRHCPENRAPLGYTGVLCYTCSR